MPVLQQALTEKLVLLTEEWHGMNISGLQPRHYVRAGIKILVPRRQHNHRLVKCLKTSGWRVDLTSMDNLFATVHLKTHYFTLQWCKTTGAFPVRDDSPAPHTKPENKEAMVLLWALLLASARADDAHAERKPAARGGSRTPTQLPRKQGMAYSSSD